MAHHTVVEFNHDKIHEIEKAVGFGLTLKKLLSDSYLPERQKLLLREFGIKIIEQHHSDDCPY